MANELIIKNGLVVVGNTNISSNGVITGSLTILGATIFTASQATSASYAVTSSYVVSAATASYVTLAKTASYVETASWAQNTHLLSGTASGDFATLNSNKFIGNQTVSGSLFTTGSNTLVGNTQLTGSLGISGSTIQVGNNTLLGNTILTGSIIISGSENPGVPSVKIFGAVDLDGYLKLSPVDANIDNSISASYIYVSGSTNDLYFTQNGLGYNNTTRLRWLEANLYTGLLNGGFITTQSATTYQISSGSGIVVNLNASLHDNPYPTIAHINWSNISASIAPLSASYDQTFVSVTSAGSIYAQGIPYNDGQFNTLIPIGVVVHQNRSTINATQTFPSVAYGYKQRSSDFIRAFGALRLSGLNTYASGSSTGSLVISSGTAFAEGRNYSVDPNNPSYITDAGSVVSKIYRYYQSGSSWNYNTNNGAGYLTIDPTQYSNNGTLTAVPGVGSNRQWSIQRVYWFAGGATKGIYVYYGNATYVTQGDAIANIDIEQFTEAPNTAASAVFSAYLIVRNDADFTNTATYQIIQAGLFRSVGGSGGGGSAVSQTLSGLGDVNISGPTNGQPLVYNGTTLKWENSSVLTASLNGNATTATNAVTSSYVTWDNVDVIETDAFAGTASYSIVAATANAVAFENVTGKPTLISSSLQFSSADNVTFGDITASIIQVDTLLVQHVTSSGIYSTGSNVFGSVLSNAHQFTGSVYITGSLTVAGDVTFTDQYIDTTASHAVSSSYVGGGVDATSYTQTQGGLTSYVVNVVTAIPSASTTPVEIFSDTLGWAAKWLVGVRSGSNHRTSEVIASWDSTGNVLSFTEYSTTDVGNTNDINLTVDISSNNVRLLANTTAGNWDVRATRILI